VVREVGAQAFVDGGDGTRVGRAIHEDGEDFSVRVVRDVGELDFAKVVLGIVEVVVEERLPGFASPRALVVEQHLLQVRSPSPIALAQSSPVLIDVVSKKPTMWSSFSVKLSPARFRTCVRNSFTNFSSARVRSACA
jgi:hypothetical protein